MIIPNRFTIHLTSICNLKCKFCWNSTHKLDNDIMSLLEFENILKWLKTQNIKEIDLTPMVGEIFIISNINSYFELLEKYNFKYYIITSLIQKANYNLINFKNLYLSISLYVYNKIEYNKITGKDKFNNLYKNIKQFSRSTQQTI